jgi:hypothetical protein
VATVVLGVAGNAILPGIGGIIGAGIGSFIDSQFLFPALFGKDQEVRGPRLEDLRIMTSGQGAGMHYCMGPENRVAGHCIWKSGIREKVIEQEQGGGKGGGGSSVTSTSYEYFMDLAIAFAERPWEGSISRIVKILADGKTIYKDDPDIDITRTDLAVRKVEITQWIPWPPPDGQDIVTGVEMHVDGPSGWAGSLRVGINVQISGYTNGGNNGTFVLIRKETVGSIQTAVFQNASCVDETAGDSVTFFQNLPKFDSSRMDSVTIKKGGTGQNPDSLIEADLGVGLTPGYRRTVYAVVGNLFLGDFGNRIPRIEAYVEAHESPYTYREAITAVMRRAGFSNSEFDVTEVPTDLELRGYTVTGPHAPNKILENLLLAGELNVRKVNGVLTFFPIEGEQTITVDPNLLGCYEEGDEPPVKLDLLEQPRHELPTAVRVKFVDAGKKYQDGSRDFQFIVRENDSIDTFDVPITLSSGEGLQLARSILVRLHNERQSGDFRLPPSMVGIGEGTLVDADGFSVRVSEVTRGASFLNELKGTITVATDIDPSNEEDDEDEDDDGVYIPPHCTLLLANMPALTETHVNSPGFYWAVAATDIEAEWRGMGLFGSFTQGGPYEQDANSGVETIMGRALTVLAEGPVGFFDRANTVDIQLFHGSIASVTESQVLTGANRMWIGSELIGFQTVQDLGDNQYRLSNLIRALRNTEDGMANHNANELCAALAGATTQFRQINSGDINTTRYYKPLPLGGDIADQDESSLLRLARTVWCFGPAHVEGEFDSGDIDVTWVRRTRAFYDPFSGLPVPLLPASEGYEVDLLDKSTGDPSVTYTGLTTPAVTILAADQTTAGYTGSEPVNINVYQIGDIVARGVATPATVG